MFREARDSGEPAPTPLSPRRRRLAGRYGAGPPCVALAVGGGGVAAAYTGNLPDPIQEFAHRALGPVAPPRPTSRAPTGPRTSRPPPPPPPRPGSPTPPPTPTDDPVADAVARRRPTRRRTRRSRPRRPPPHPRRLLRRRRPRPTPTPTPTATEVPTPTPTATPTVVPPPVVAAVSISGSTHKVEPGQSVAFSGVVTSDDGNPMRRKKVTLQARAGSRWVRVTSGRTDASGQVTLVLPPIPASTAVRLRSNGVHSTRWRVTLHPQVSVSSSSGPRPRHRRDHCDHRSEPSPVTGSCWRPRPARSRPGRWATTRCPSP